MKKKQKINSIRIRTPAYVTSVIWLSKCFEQMIVCYWVWNRRKFRNHTLIIPANCITNQNIVNIYTHSQRSYDIDTELQSLIFLTHFSCQPSFVNNVLVLLVIFFFCCFFFYNCFQLLLRHLHFCKLIRA